MNEPTSIHRSWAEALRAPLEVVPDFVHRPYVGGHEARRFRRARSRGDDHWTEEWLGSQIPAGNPGPDGRPQGLTTVRDQDGRMVKLKDLVEAFPEEMLGASFADRYGARIGFLVKIISLSSPGPVHTHPSGDFAKRYLDQDHGQAEAWVILEVKAGDEAQVPAGIGFRSGVHHDDLVAAIGQGSSEGMRSLLRRTTVAAGETWLIRPGVPHYLGGGVLFIEIQEPSDCSVVAEHWGIGADESGATMGLGWERALDAFDFPEPGEAGGGDVERAHQRPSWVRERGQNQEDRLVDPAADAPFDVRRIDVADDFAGESGRLSVDVVTSGGGWLEGDWGRRPIVRGDAFVMPASLEHRFVAEAPPLRINRCMGPAVPMRPPR